MSKIKYFNSLNEERKIEGFFAYYLRKMGLIAPLREDSEVVSFKQYWEDIRIKLGLRKERDMRSSLIVNALSDPEGIGKLELMLYNVHTPWHYRYIFHQLPYHISKLEGKRVVCIDCGAHAGLMSDIFLWCGAETHAFEPNPAILPFLRKKFSQAMNEGRYVLNPKAVADSDGEMELFVDDGGVLSQGIRIVGESKEMKSIQKVEVVDLVRYIKELGDVDIYFLKIDVEGAEFGIIEKLIKEGLHKKIHYIACETHERFFSDGEEKMRKIRELIKSNNIKNIFLDWV